MRPNAPDRLEILGNNRQPANKERPTVPARQAPRFLPPRFLQNQTSQKEHASLPPEVMLHILERVPPADRSTWKALNKAFSSDKALRPYTENVNRSFAAEKKAMSAARVLKLRQQSSLPASVPRYLAEPLVQLKHILLHRTPPDLAYSSLIKFVHFGARAMNVSAKAIVRGATLTSSQELPKLSGNLIEFSLTR